MRTLPSKVQQRLKLLSNKFVKDLPQRLTEIDLLMVQAKEGDVESLRDLLQQTHKLAGSATTFGFEDLTDLSRRAEQHIERDLTIHPPVLGPESTDALRAVIAFVPERRTSADVGTQDGPDGVAPAETGGSIKIVYQIGRIPGFTDELGGQLAVFGIQLVQIATLDGLEDHIARQNENGDTAATNVLLSTVGFFGEKTSRLKQLTSLRTMLGHSLVTVLVGSEDDFDTRLRSVRYGADAFLPTPIDVTQLVDLVETMVDADAVTPYHVLVVDDDPEQVSDTALVLQEAGMITSVVTDPRSIFQVLVDCKPELILMDMYMPICNGAELASIIRQSSNFVGIPIIFLSVETDAKKQLEAIQSGADGFLTKPIEPKYLVAFVRMRAARTRAMRFYMERDSLTGLLNHTNLKQYLEYEVRRSRRIGTSLVFAMIDIDKFKSVNDTYGHLTGDRVLKSLSRLLEERLRRTDIVGRYGGEEFGIILFNTDMTRARKIMDEIRESFSRLKQYSGETEFYVTFSGGIAGFPDFDNASDLSESADSALYDAKQAGRNCIIVAEH